MSPTMNELARLVKNMKDLENELRKYELKYHLLSADFYRLVQSYKIEQTPDFIMWLGTYQAWLSRKRKYQRLLKSELTPLVGFLNREAHRDKLTA